MKRYEEYKDSGVEWIGEVPRHWEAIRIKDTGFLYGGLVGKSGDDFRDEENPNNRPYIPFTNIFRNTYIAPDNFGMVVINDGEEQNRAQKHDLFFLMSSEDYEDLGKASILLHEYSELYLNSFCKGLRITNESVYPLFLNYQLSGYTHKKLISVEGSGFTRINLRQDKLRNTPVLLPPLPEQHQIVSFLDEKTALIDDLIQKKEQKIALLKEYRSSLINRVVTKGLNPNAPMKDSGVEWIGEVPSHWDCPLGSRIGKYSKGSGIKKDEVVESGLPCIRYGQIYTIYNHSVSQVQSYITDQTSETSVSVGYGTLLITGSGETKEDIGKCIVYTGDTPVWVGGDIIILHPDETYNPLYLTYLMNSECVRIQKEQLSKGEIVVHIYSKNFSQMRFTLPPLPEQHQIVSFLDEKTGEIDRTINSEQKKIELLKEYRQSLISSVVTGKIKVVD